MTKPFQVIVLICLSVLCGNAIRTQRASEPVTRPAVRERADRVMREVPLASGNRVKEIVEELHGMLTSETPGDSRAVTCWGHRVNELSGEFNEHQPLPDRNSVLSRVIPILISQIDDAEGARSKAWWVLIQLQPHCPAPKRAEWERWWEKTGRHEYAVTP